MLCSCQRTTGMVADVPALVREKLQGIKKAYPNVKYACVVNNVGSLIAALSPDDEPPGDMLTTAAALKQSAIQFASALNQRDCPVMHLTGDYYMFSLYEIGDFLLAFYTDIPSGPFSAIEIVDSNDIIFEIVADLRLMLQNIITK
mmetsp:Transcript_25000/g.42273  ORF Transcript_25000/g.42273 Transcript_25000/m.42273 type:complete len:145 (+) Transcript_25000:50-484(+)